VCKEQNTGKGVVTCRTPLGLGIDEWEEGLEKYAKLYQAIDGVDNCDIRRNDYYFTPPPTAKPTFLLPLFYKADPLSSG
jgi:hypothetical protein